ncbi:DNA mismatch repair endonuclease MutL [Caldinitratiruptor microaerophilus]|uniref:DNA mismatch repair protein MutL n=1 Tax=Caldinitratiruptor microaerophilus TaxID=671077 RepID=A0AA35G5S1_9FIRM|nr:DNA mismatch repair endonuclease MutL [Caldinitratiruptor microaerophilus]BDG60001.1 DNA mismatch repair protein MutL [Caldinitratiruptor microaerophilus]
MGLIRVLDERTANQIAAGEVVERPASVVKELVENSLDAGARRITVEVAGGGRELIQVVDDGCGMGPDDARLALERHATSKIASAEDLRRIRTLGFRGEALPSIASVSRLVLRTRPRDRLEGTCVRVEGGGPPEVEACGCPPGTAVEVRDLFYNTPARLKFLKTDATELGRITEVVGRLALASPGVVFRLRAGPAELLTTPGTGDLLATVHAVLGREVARALVPVEWEGGGVRVWGYAGLPQLVRAGRAHQLFFVNGRSVTDRVLRFAFEEAYRNAIPEGRHPVAVLFVAVDPEEVDVNVHPAKAEVRFRNERAVRAAVYQAVREALAAHAGLAPRGFGSGYGPAPGPAPPPGAPSAAPLQRAFPAFPSAVREVAAGAARPAPPAAAASADGGPGPDLLSREEAERAALGYPAPGQEPRTPADLIRSLRPLGQVHRTYIACDGPEGLYLVDQHAAHERVYFERVLRELESRPVAVQLLLFPATLELTPARWALWTSVADILRDAGIHAEPFGRQTLRITAIPDGVPEAHAVRLVADLLDRLAEEDLPSATVERRRRAVAALAACRAAIKANDPLAPAEQQALLDALAACEHPGECPHGRPTLILVSRAELERRFGRRG